MSANGENDAGPSRSSTPLRSAPSTVLSASLAAHLSKPTFSAAHEQQSEGNSPTRVSEAPTLLSGNFVRSGKASAIAVDSDKIAHGDVWKSVAARRAEKAWAIESEKTLQSDSRFKKYAAAVDKCLLTFESVSEWADFIAFLGRLLKVLQTYPQFNAIPRKLTVAKRLSQCLNPALPSGVHQRALEVYEHILSTIGTEGLRRDLIIWTPGLLPFFQYASTSVKPIILSLVERYYMSLSQDLRPLAKPMQLSLLPGLEEEATELFERTLKVLDQVQNTIGQQYFIQNLWLLLITTGAVRMPTLHYLSRRLPHLNGDDGDPEVSSVVGPDLGLTVRAFSAALQDNSSLLVQRATLDILVTHLRLDSPTFLKSIRPGDRILLFQGALSIVLRRDLSLNRRLYSWLLGSSDEQEIQQSYFETYALQWAKDSLMEQMWKDASPEKLDAQDQGKQISSSERQRPYRILVTLLDKWSIGSPMTNAIIVETFKTLKVQLDPVGLGSSAPATDISTTAKMLFEAVDPFAMYRQFYYALCKESKSPNLDSKVEIVSLLRFIFASFRVHDEESRIVHLPTLFAVVMELVNQSHSPTWIAEAVQLASEILVLIPKRIFAGRSTLSNAKTQSFVQHAAQLYDEKTLNADEAAKKYIGFQHPETIQALIHMVGAALSKDKSIIVDVSSILCRLLNMIDASANKEQDTVSVPFDGESWEKQIVTSLSSSTSFAEVEAYVEILIAKQNCKALANKGPLTSSNAPSIIVEVLLRFLHPGMSPFHVRTAELFWSIFDLVGENQIKPVLCLSLATGNSEEYEDAFETFATLWKHSDDSRLAHPALVGPLFAVLDGLKSPIWMERQLSETWIRNQNRPFTALLNPLLQIINVDGASKIQRELDLDGLSIVHYKYKEDIDHTRIQYALSSLLQITKLGGAPLSRALRISTAHQSWNKEAKRSPNKVEGDIKGTTYGQLLIDQLTTLLDCDAPENSPYLSQYESIHALSASLLHSTVNRMQLQDATSNEVETSILQRLLLSVHHQTLHVQGTLLQALHSILSVQMATQQSKNKHPHDFLLPALKAGLSSIPNRKVLQHWTDFALNISTLYQRSITNLLIPLNQGLCALTRDSVQALSDTYSDADTKMTSTCMETDIIMFMTISEKVLIQSLELQDRVRAVDTPLTEGNEGRDPFGIVGALTNVFSAEAPVSKSADQASSHAVWKSLHHTVRTLHQVWLNTTPNEFISSIPSSIVPDSRVDTLAYNKAKIHSRCRRYLEKLYRHHSGEVVEALITCWQNPVPPVKSQEAVFEMLSLLAPSAQIVVTFLCDVISTRTNPTPVTEKASKNSASSVVSNVTLFSFLEAYLTRLDGSISLQVWPVFIILIKDILASSTQHKAEIFPALKCFTVIADKIMDDSVTYDDRKAKRDLTESYVRLADLAVLLAGRSFEQNTWIGRRTVQIDDSDENKDLTKDEKLSMSVGDVSMSNVGFVEALQMYLADSVLPFLRKSAGDTDKVAGLASNIVYYVISPALKQRKRYVYAV